MTKKILFLNLLLGLIYFQINAQTDDITRCATEQYLEMQDIIDPGYPLKRQQIEEDIQNWITANKDNFNENKAVITIPVVVHILYYQDHPAFNLPESRVLEQIAVLNRDYRRLNTDASETPSVFQSVAADCEIEFCLAKRTPTGQYTNGIVRVQTTVTQFSIGSAMKYTSQGGSNAWDRNKYLNLWVCNIGGGILGFAQPPGSAAATDGVVIHYRYFGTTGASSPYNEGRTATHEIGHWLGLWHVWGDDNGACTGSDQCNDTPNSADAYYGCPTHPQNTCSSDDMFMNYMDYVDDGCMNTFTTGQKMRMWATLNGSRVSIKTSDGCVPGQGMNVFENDAISDFSIYPNPSSGNLNLDITLNENVPELEISILNTYGQVVYSESLINENNIIHKNIDLSGLAKGFYIMNITSELFSLNKKITLY
ncbi:MAG: M43 family zinc metalloprotease [Bacteroidales bacterium]|nr:M43 family zinc metalloprotease [Bacteroidales bacterium]